MTRSSALLLVLAILATGFALLFLGRAGFRYYALHKIFRNPEVRHRIAMMPTRRNLPPPSHGHEVNLGFARFDAGAPGPVKVEVTWSGDTSVYVSGEDWNLVSLSLSTVKDRRAKLSIEDMKKNAGQRPQMAAVLEQMVTDPIAAEIKREQIQELPFRRWAFMSSDEFMEYLEFLALKDLSYGRNLLEVYEFSTPTSRGIVRIGVKTGDRKRAGVILASADNQWQVGVLAMTTNSSTREVATVLDPILASLEFTLPPTGTRDDVLQRLARAGIKAKTDSPEAPE